MKLPGQKRLERDAMIAIPILAAVVLWQIEGGIWYWVEQGYDWISGFVG